MIKLRKLITERTGYHGTTVANVPSIEKHGLIPQAGEFTSNAYNEIPSDEMPELVFATDKSDIGNAVTAATQHVANQLKKDFHSVTDDEFLRYAAICKIYDVESAMEHRPEGDEDYYGRYPSTVEPGDYYSEGGILPDEILMGNQMRRLLKRYGLFPRGDHYYKPSDDQKKNWLIKLYLKRYPEPNRRREIVQRVLGLDKKDLEYWYSQEKWHSHD